MNIGVAGRTGHDFENHDEKSNTLIWFSKPNKHSSNPLFQKINFWRTHTIFFCEMESETAIYVFGHGDNTPFGDGYKTPQGHECIRLVISVDELHDIISPDTLGMTNASSYIEREKSSFLFERQLEDFLVSNWDRTPLSENYEIFEQNGQQCGQQFRTDIGPIDILGQRRDKSDFLVVELKRDRASDVVVGQALRYMGWIKAPSL